MTNQRKIFMTGASGLIGSELVKQISTLGYSVNAIYRKNISLQHKNINWIKADLSDIDVESIKPFLNDVDILIHNAASTIIGNTLAEEERIRKTNIDASVKLFQLAGKAGVKKAIFTSSFSFIQKPLPSIIVESSPINAVTPYGMSKHLGENYLKEYAEKYGFKFNIFRVSSPVSFNLALMPTSVVRKWIEESREDKIIKIYGKGTRTQDFVAVTDIAKAFISSIENIDISGTFNIVSGNQLSMLHLAQLITEKFGNTYEFIGNDTNENDRWNISIKKASQLLDYQPEYTSETAIKTLLQNI
ncbi:NAD(P)-dependent oxidoreductase [Anabaena cylindrica FACHB-243]|uniref:NAD-dependent epimerase/dehydratase n=1 Tax=Anabaena cylindrica (strain ATCC 27899 / PCC 7122) TaxID=272123 RepID=K9ZEC1_ANACC|nr:MULTISPECIES: NAD(P)-dependent oxidoreductase [Anabaena]AFZ56952.1 NAD-dependent epimerase/dehydratase [Anabaena cylindrica PCC 7122]MBD2418862.1 NAD(P)-dependent oxidoreductase [Anabaena cylindrica FACHB-243]MBY5285768.1 NAD(P)-dependent oxidoreductase [Anabaena sp. CCAP 1446/1C]MBY5308753.1 NAD(P)-dependent oxidoreductase [Anabaena sp. CCAP 1446/1C]MCM2405142.1 NAD(P)-dependent oxidoreductase [Anabaena sp. CCAP 1446/1C]